MPHYLDVELSKNKKAEMADTPEEAWFTAVDFRNAKSPRHPGFDAQLEANNEMKRELILPWITSVVEGKRVLDLFCANGAFSAEAALAGAKEVVGIDFSPERIEVAQFLASTLEDSVACNFTFMSGDVYELPNLVSEPFDVVIALGGLYHVANPPYVLTKIRSVTKERFIVQTSNILSSPGNWGRFEIREDWTGEGFTSLRGGHGAWSLTPECFQAMLVHARFQELESLRPPLPQLQRFPWYCSLAKPV